MNLFEDQAACYSAGCSDETIIYTLDLAASLSQGSRMWSTPTCMVWDASPKNQQRAQIYFLPDTLNSIRQLATNNGTIRLTQSFDPFGNLHAQRTAGFSSFGLAGEWTGPTYLGR